MESTIHKQQKRSVMEIKTKNMAEKRFLHHQLSKLDDDVRDYKSGYDKTIKNLKTECESYWNHTDYDNLSVRSDLHEYYNSFPTISKVARGLGISSAQPHRQTTPRMPSTSPDGKICKFGCNSNCCVSFPCLIPKQYNSLGFDIDQNRKNALDRFITSSQTSADVRDKLLEKLEENSVRRPLKCGLNLINQREMGLKRMIEDKRLKNTSRKPVDYSVHYGAPISRRRLKSVPSTSNSNSF